MTTLNNRVSVWRPPEAAPQGCHCRHKGVVETIRVTCGGTADHINGCPGMTGWVTQGGFWSQDLPPPPASSPVLNPRLYDEHADLAVAHMKSGRASSLAEACRQAVSELGRGKNWAADDPKIGVPDRLYKRAGDLLKGD